MNKRKSGPSAGSSSFGSATPPGQPFCRVIVRGPMRAGERGRRRAIDREDGEEGENEDGGDGETRRVRVRENLLRPAILSVSASLYLSFCPSQGETKSGVQATCVY